jgi:hypothetical protein
MAARKSAIEIDFGVFEDLADQLEKLGADLKECFAEAMEKEGKKVTEDTVKAVADVNLPAGGKYSSQQKETKASIIMDPKVEWSGSEAVLPLGFDKSKPGAGGFLITGTPKMHPDYALEKIYGQKKYERDVRKAIMGNLEDQIHKRLGQFE